MDCRTYELYDENEYFLKYLNIHPILRYSNKEVDRAKKEFQINLLNKFNQEVINYDELCNIYQNALKIEQNNKKILYNIQEQHQKIEEEITNNISNNLIIFYNQFTN